MKNKASYEQVYYAETTNRDRPLNLIAIRPKIEGDHIEWEDTSWGTRFEVMSIQFKQEKTDLFPQQIIISLKNGEAITLQKLTLSIYDEKVKHWVMGKIAFNSDEELQNYYLTTAFGS